MYDAMILSLGGAPEPLRKSIECFQPAVIVFFASQQSAVMAGEVLKGLPARPETFFEMTENSDELLACYEAARRCLLRIEASQAPPDRVMVDYTGGTKPMVAALVLATVGRGYRFNYVGGSARDKNGLGIVRSGSEHMMFNVSPWAAFAEEERRNAAILFNERKFGAVVDLFNNFDRLDEMPYKIRSYLEWLKLLAEGYALWERFEYLKGAEIIKKGHERLLEHLRMEYHERLDEVRAAVENNLDFLNQLRNSTRGLKRVHPLLVEDLLANAGRRIQDRQFEDATARIYRALEMHGQAAFFEHTGLETSNVPPENVPQSIRDEYALKYLDPKSGKLKLPLFAVYRFLAEAGHAAGVRFMALKENLDKVLFARNHSFLAHGTIPIDQSSSEKLLDIVMEFTGIRPYIEFPRLP